MEKSDEENDIFSKNYGLQISTYLAYRSYGARKVLLNDQMTND